MIKIAIKAALTEQFLNNIKFYQSNTAVSFSGLPELDVFFAAPLCAPLAAISQLTNNFKNSGNREFIQYSVVDNGSIEIKSNFTLSNLAEFSKTETNLGESVITELEVVGSLESLLRIALSKGLEGEILNKLDSRFYLSETSVRFLPRLGRLEKFKMYVY